MRISLVRISLLRFFKTFHVYLPYVAAMIFLQCPTQACFHPHTKSNWVSLLFSTSFDISLLGNLTRICVPLQNNILVLYTHAIFNMHFLWK